MSGPLLRLCLCITVSRVDRQRIQLQTFEVILPFAIEHTDLGFHPSLCPEKVDDISNLWRGLCLASFHLCHLLSYSETKAFVKSGTRLTWKTEMLCTAVRVRVTCWRKVHVTRQHESNA
jgi:hypothetical protein